MKEGISPPIIKLHHWSLSTLLALLTRRGVREIVVAPAPSASGAGSWALLEVVSWRASSAPGGQKLVLGLCCLVEAPTAERSKAYMESNQLALPNWSLSGSSNSSLTLDELKCLNLHVAFPFF